MIRVVIEGEIAHATESKHYFILESAENEIYELTLAKELPDCVQTALRPDILF